MKSLLKSLRMRYRFYRECYLDAKRFEDSISSQKLSPDSAVARIESDIVRQYHVIEKGLCMPDFRPRFGKDMIAGLLVSLEQLAHHPSSSSTNRGQVEAAKTVIRCYLKRHEELGIDVSDLLPPAKQQIWESPTQCDADGGIKSYVAAEAAHAAGFERIARGRVSVRKFIPDQVPDRDLVLDSVEIALRAPSVCNRQTSRIHVLTGESAIRALALQSGNRGFGHQIPMVIIVTSDLRFFTGTVERYQAWIDGGMFSMLLLLALHAKGLGAVSLNWSVNNEPDRKLREAVGIPHHERIIMLIGCGHPADDCMVPVSKRRAASEITRWD